MKALCCFALLGTLLIGCNSRPRAGSVQVQGLSLDDPARPLISNGPVQIEAARNEWSDFAIQITGLPPLSPKDQYVLRIAALKSQSGASIDASNFAAFAVLSVPVDCNRADYIRHNGLLAEKRSLPRILLPLQQKGSGIFSLAGPEAQRPTMLWGDLHLPISTVPGEYVGVCELADSEGGAAFASLPLHITVHDFVLPDQRKLTLVNRLRWQDLTQHYPQRFEAVTRRLLNRSEPRYRSAVAALDQLMHLAAANRTGIALCDLEPTVKWPAGRAPVFDWSDYDSLVTPWLSGESFPDKIPLSYWPLPQVENLERFDRTSRGDYWSAVASHFDQKDWLGRCSVFLESANQPASIQSDASDILRSHTRIRVTARILEDQLQLAGIENPHGIDAGSMPRLTAMARGLVFAPAARPWPKRVDHPRRYLRADLPGLMPYAETGGGASDVRLWAALAYLHQADLIVWESTLPKSNSASQPADPNEMVWFYPGEWFGVNEPLPTLQLKWLRRAQQDYDYLRLAEQRGEVSIALVIARLMTKPVEMPRESPDPAAALLCGTSEGGAWGQARQLLAQTIVLHDPAKTPEASKLRELDLRTLRWAATLEHPTLMPRSASWQWARAGGEVGNWLELKLGVDVYNASDDRPENNTLGFGTLSEGWRIKPQPTSIPPLPTYQITPVNLAGKFDLDSLHSHRTEPIELMFTNGYDRSRIPLRLVLPLAASQKRVASLNIDGSLEDWNSADAIADGPLVRMLNRPALQSRQLQYAASNSSVYTSWSAEQLYLAFKLEGAWTSDLRQTRNFVDYQFRRAWGEDLCELLIQPVYVDNSLGPVTHLVCKPSGQWAERKAGTTQPSDQWHSFEGSGIRYASTISVDERTWRGEVAIPWSILNTPGRGLPSLLRFNFSQHQHATGESASWAGPIDHGRDDAFMGLLHLRE